MSLPSFTGYRFGPRSTSAVTIARYGVALPLLLALRDIVLPQATRCGNRLAPPSIVAEATILLDEARHILSREPGIMGLLEPPTPQHWAALLSKIEFALVAFQDFRDAYYFYDSEAEGFVWYDEDWVDVVKMRDEERNGASDLPETEPDLSP